MSCFCFSWRTWCNGPLNQLDIGRYLRGCFQHMVKKGFGLRVSGGSQTALTLSKVRKKTLLGTLNPKQKHRVACSCSTCCSVILQQIHVILRSKKRCCSKMQSLLNPSVLLGVVTTLLWSFGNFVAAALWCRILVRCNL